MQTRASLGLLVALGLSCARPSERDTAEADPQPPPAERGAEPPAPAAGPMPPQAELLALDRCSEPLERLMTLPPAERAEWLAGALPGLTSCVRMFYARCEAPIEAVAPGKGLEHLRATIDACLTRYCPQWPKPERPAMCQGSATAFLEATSSDRIQAQAQGFLAAMLAQDFGRPREDGTIERVVGRFAPLWTAPVVAVNVSPPSFASTTADPLQLQVEVTRKAFVLSGEGIESVRIPAGDVEALTRRAQALKREHPDAREVTLRAADDVELQTLIDTMDALRGECTPTGEGPRCLFPHPILQTGP